MNQPEIPDAEVKELLRYAERVAAQRDNGAAEEAASRAVEKLMKRWNEIEPEKRRAWLANHSEAGRGPTG